MRLYLDDLHPIPIGFDAVARNAKDAIALLSSGEVEHISLDHDLDWMASIGMEPLEQTGYHVAVWIEEAVREGRIPMPTWEVHSMNPTGAERIKAAMRSAERFATPTPPSRAGRGE